MANRTRPFTIYSEKDIIPMYALEHALSNDKVTDSGNGDIGVFVTISKADFSEPPFEYIEEPSVIGSLDKADHFGSKATYPVNPNVVKPAKQGDVLLGMTLDQTAKNDSLGQTLLWEKRKREENHAVLPGRSVRILERGWVQIYPSALQVTNTSTLDGIAVNDFLTLADAANAGKLAKWVAATGEAKDPQKVAVVRAVGKEDTAKATPYLTIELL